MKTLTAYEAGKPFPGPVPTEEGAILEMTAGGPVVLIQCPGLTRPEVQAFKKGFRSYAFWSPPGVPVPIAIWAFEFQKPLSPMDVNFDAHKADRGHVEAYLETHEGLKNALTFHLLDGPMLRANKIVGLEPAAVKLFHATIRAQLAAKYTAADFDRYLDGVYNYSTVEILAMGTRFKHR